MREQRKKKIIKKYTKNSLKHLTLVSGLTMLSLGTGISLSSYVVQANEANNATLISQSSSSSSNSQTSESQSSSPNSSILANSEATSVSSTEKTSSNDSPSNSSANAISETQNTDSSTSSSVTSKSSKDTVISSSSSASTDSSSTSSTNSVSTTSDSKTTSSSSSTTDTSISTIEASETLNTTTTTPTPVALSAVVTSLLSVKVPDNISIGDNNYTRADAIDISSYQYWITLTDFLQLKSLGIKSVIVKITEGTTYANPYAASQISLAEQAGLNVAVYHYATFSDASSGSAQGQHTAQVIQSLGLNKNVLIFADMEDKTTLSDSVQSALYAFWNSLTTVGFNNHGVYTYISYAYRDQVVATVGKARTWIAQYPYTPSRGGYYENAWENEGYGGWQFSSTAYVNGHSLDISHDYNGLLTNISNLDDNLANIDNISVSGNKVSISGWHVSPTSTIEQNAYVIMFDSTTNKEIERIKYTPIQRTDVSDIYWYIPNSAKSGFAVSFTIPSGYKFGGKNIQFVLRYSDDSSGNGNTTDIWSKDYVLTDNIGNIDNWNLNSKNILHVDGWHAAETSYRYAYLIVFDDTTGKEITRIAYTPTTRSDVANSNYGYISDSNQSGFSQNINLGTTLVNGHQLQIVMRYSDAINGEGNHMDYWSNTYTIANANAAYIDSFSLNANNILHVAGWHAADASTALKYAYLIIFDDTTGKEIKRVSYNPISRPDVAKNGYASVYNAAQSGFSQDISLGSTSVKGHRLQIVMRYSDSETGEGTRIDYWSSIYNIPNSNTNAAYIDSFSLNANNILHVAGWHAADASIALQNAFLIVFDTTTGKEIKRVSYTPISRPDVAKNGYANVYNATQSGFSQDIALGDTLVNGHQLQIVMRYSDAKNGEGKRIDYWSDKHYIANNNAGHLDNFYANSNGIIHVSGWHAADASTTLKYAYLIVFDTTTNKEVTRIGYTPISRPDVVKNGYANIYAASQSGFSKDIELSSNILKQLKGHTIQIVMRYSSNAITGEGARIDYWSDKKIL